MKNRKYSECVDNVILKCCIGDTITISCTQRIARFMAHVFDWVKDVNIVVRPDLANENILEKEIVCGKILHEIDLSDNTIPNIKPEIQFYDHRLITINILLHELAHMYEHQSNHNDSFYYAESILKKVFIENCENFL